MNDAIVVGKEYRLTYLYGYLQSLFPTQLKSQLL